MAESSSLLSPGKPLAVTFPSGGVLNLTYNSMALPFGFQAPVGAEPEAWGRHVADFVCHVVTSWDLAHGGVPDPVGWEHRDEMIQIVEAEIFARVYKAVRDDIAPHPTTSTNSQSGSAMNSTTAAATSRSTRAVSSRTTAASGTTAFPTGTSLSSTPASPGPTS